MTNTDVEALKAQKAALEAEVSGLQTKLDKRASRRHIASLILVVITVLGLLVSVTGTWARRNALDTDRFTERADAIAADPDVQRAISAQMSTRIVTLIDTEALVKSAFPERGALLVGPIEAAVQDFVRDRTDKFVTTDRFHTLFVGLASKSHETAKQLLEGDTPNIVAEDDRVHINLIPIINDVLADLSSGPTEIFGRTVTLPELSVDSVPEEARAKLSAALGVPLDENFGQITVYDGGKLAAAQDAVRLFNNGLIVAWAITILALVGALLISPRRRRTVIQLTVGTIIAMVVIRRLGFRIEGDVSDLVEDPTNRAAAEAVLSEFLTPLLTFASWVVAGAAAILVAALLSGDYGWAVSFRRKVAALTNGAVGTVTNYAQDDQTVAWVSEHRELLQIAIAGIGVVLLWTLDISWFGFLLIVALVGAAELIVSRMRMEPSPRP